MDEKRQSKTNFKPKVAVTSSGATPKMNLTHPSENKKLQKIADYEGDHRRLEERHEQAVVKLHKATREEQFTDQT